MAGSLAVGEADRLIRREFPGRNRPTIKLCESFGGPEIISVARTDELGEIIMTLRPRGDGGPSDSGQRGEFGSGDEPIVRLCPIVH